MLEYLYLFLSFIFFLKFSKNLLSVSFVLLGHLYFLVLMLGYFHIYKFQGDFNPFFPDELTYIEGRTNLIYSWYVSNIYPIVTESYFRVSNLFFYFLSWILIFNTKDSCRLSLFDFFCVLVAVAGLYWCYFLLKEALSISGLIMLFYSFYIRSIFLKVISMMLLIIARVDLLIFFFLSRMILKTYQYSKKLFSAFILLSTGILYWFLSSSYSYPLKLMIGSRRFGESNKVFDSELKVVSQGDAFSYLFSNVYLETVIANVRRSFDPFFGGVSLASILVTFNLITMLYFIGYRLLRKKLYFYDCYFLLVITILMASHSVYRYVNVLVISYLAALVIYKKCESFNYRRSF